MKAALSSLLGNLFSIDVLAFFMQPDVIHVKICFYDKITSQKFPGYTIRRGFYCKN